MKMHFWPAAAVLLGCMAVLFNAQCASNEPSIQWHVIDTNGPPQSFLVSPSDPTITNVISFVAPTDGQIYLNSCVASVTNGVPGIVVDQIFQKITVSFSAPETNVACSFIALPVSGVDGEIGPLGAGAWTFDILGSSYPFTVTYVPLALSVQQLSNSTSLQISWPNSGEACELESCSNILSGNWLPVTNTLVLSNNSVTVPIDSASTARFFRLQRLTLQ
jgi:hypothetical protein